MVSKCHAIIYVKLSINQQHESINKLNKCQIKTFYGFIKEYLSSK